MCGESAWTRLVPGCWPACSCMLGPPQGPCTSPRWRSWRPSGRTRGRRSSRRLCRQPGSAHERNLGRVRGKTCSKSGLDGLDQYIQQKRPVFNMDCAALNEFRVMLSRASEIFQGCLSQSSLKNLGQILTALAIWGRLERFSPGGRITR